MSDMNDPDVIQPITRTCQIIVGALIMGVVFFLAITMFLVSPAMNPAPVPAGGEAGGAALLGPAGPELPLITYIAVALSVAGLVLSFIVPNIFVTNARRQIAKGTWTPPATRDPSPPARIYPAGDTGKLAMLYQTQLIIGSALCEGMAFFATIAYLLERNPMALVTAIVLIGGLIARFPTADRVNAWLDQQQSKLQIERQADF
jgi:hypothetical protein